MSVEVLADPAALAVRAADVIAAEIGQKPDLRVLVATGNTPMATYAELAKRADLDASQVVAVQLDEYLGVLEDDPRSLYAWMRRSFVEPLGVRQVVRLDGGADPEAASRAFDAETQRLGGLDLAILGLGPNGHLGFNEPPCGPEAPTRRVGLTPESLASNAGYWPDLAVPREALTAGMPTILNARRVLLLVQGAHKRDVLHRALHGPETPAVPASWLRRANTLVLADQAAHPESGGG